MLLSRFVNFARRIWNIAKKNIKMKVYTTASLNDIDICLI